MGTDITQRHRSPIIYNGIEIGGDTVSNTHTQTNSFVVGF